MTLLSTDIANISKLTVLEDVGSDHRPIFISIGRSGGQQAPKRTRWNYKKANWAAYAQETDTNLASISEGDVHKAYTAIITNILKAARKYIPQGNI